LKEEKCSCDPCGRPRERHILKQGQALQLPMKKKFILKKNEKKTIVINTSGEYIIELNGENAEAIVVGGLIGRGDERIVIRTIQHHKSPNTVSDLLLKSVLYDQSVFDYDGLIRIDKKAQQSNAYQRNENLLLSDGAQAFSKPELEIEANDVRCTHGATIGMIDEEQVFYLMTRGLERKDAEQFIVDGFLQGAFDRMK